MDHTGVTPPVAISAPDLSDVLLGEGPFLTVYLTIDTDVENAAHRNEVRWKSMRSELADQGVPEGALAGVDPLVAEAHHEGGTLVAVATANGLVHSEHHLEPPRRDVTRWGALPMVGPLLEWRQSQVTHLVALVDRTGADLFLFRGRGPDEHEEVKGGTDPIAKSKPGGWSQGRYQNRAENTWQANAGDVASEVTAIVDREHPRLVVVGGDVRAVQLLKEELPERVRELVHGLESGQRSADGSVDHIAEEVTRVVATAVAADTAELMAKFREERNQQDRAADGPAATLEALSKGQVEVLLVHADADDGRTAWFVQDPIPVGTNPADLGDLNVGRPTEGPLVDVALRAALGTGAGVRMLPGAGGPDGGLGAILRWRE